MKNSIVIAVALIAAVLLVQFRTFASSHPDANETAAAHKAVIQLSGNDQTEWGFMMKNIKHLKDAFGESIVVEVVAYGPGIEMLLAASPQKEKITEYSKQGVSFVACENTMRLKGLKKEDIVQEASYAPSGVGELVLKQEAGWSYIKAGF